MTMTLPQIREAIQALQSEQQSLPSPSLVQIEERIQYLSARAIPGLPDAAANLAELQTQISAKSEAERHLARHAQIRNELARLNQDLQMAEQFERVAVAQSASRQCAQAHQEYVAASKEVVRAFRRVMRANQRAWNIPGAVTAPENYSLHLPAIYSDYWVGTVGQHMHTALMPFEQTEKEQQS